MFCWALEGLGWDAFELDGGGATACAYGVGVPDVCPLGGLFLLLVLLLLLVPLLLDTVPLLFVAGPFPKEDNVVELLPIW